MRAYIILLLTVISAGFSTSCSKFLDEPYDNRLDLTQGLDILEDVLVNAYPERQDMFTEILTDNYHHYANTMQANMGARYIPLYLWKDEYEETNIASPGAAYAHYYKKIYDANSVIEELAKASGDETQKKAIKGEALMIRSYAYFSLVNLFGMHYNTATSATDLGVPLVLEVPKANRPLFDRATVKQVYDQIEKDMNEGLALLKEGREFMPNTPYRFSMASIYAFFSRVSLYKSNWDDVIKYSDLAVAEKGVIVRKMSDDVNRKRTTSEQYWAQEIMNPSIHPNLLLTAQSSQFLCRPIGYRLCGFYLAHEIFYSTPNSDLRFQSFSSGGTVIDSVALVVKYANQPNNPNAAASRYDCFTMEEVLLNRAEAYLRIASPNITKAMQDIEAIRKERITPYTALPTPSTTDNALATVLKERRMELIGQGFRWYDIKRLKLRIEHRLVRTSATPDVVLEPDDKRTAIQIPINARVGNPLLENQLNPR